MKTTKSILALCTFLIMFLPPALAQSQNPPREGRVVIDFNKAHNPPCAFTPYATCPLPPESNRLTVRIEAGEKTFGDH